MRLVPKGVWAIGLVSMFMDISSEMIHSLLPVFLVGTLGASVSLVGLIEGIGEATASITKMFSGWFSDRLGKRKIFAVLGYALGAASKPLFPLATSPFLVLVARFTDRVGKGIRGAPRDALVAAMAEPGTRGLAFGVRQALDTVGAFAGPLAAIVIMMAASGNMRMVFSIAVLPAIVAVLLLVFGVEEPPRREPEAGRPAVHWQEIGHFDPAFWAIILIGVVFSLARFSEAFLALRAQSLGLRMELIPLVLIVMNVVYALISAPAGALADRLDRRLLLAAGLALLAAADLMLASCGTVFWLMTGVALWGAHMGVTQGLLSAMIADAAPDHLRGTAFGIFNLVTGVATLVASVLAGLLWQRFGASTAFLTGALFTAVTILALIVVPRARPNAGYKSRR